MSLGQEQTQRTKQELRANLALSGLTEAEVQADLGLPSTRFADVLDPARQADPVDVWLLRDYLEQAVRDTGRTPRPFTVLTEQSRRMARTWFPLETPPHHDFAK